MLSREDYVKVCQTCTKSKFDNKKGLVCSLTMEHANFSNSICPDIEVDPKAEKRQARTATSATAYLDSPTRPTGRPKDLWIGLLMLIGGTVWFIVGIAAINRIFFYPIILVAMGIVYIVKGGGAVNSSKKVNADSDILDDEII